MNEVVKSLKNHRSIRKYTDEQVSEQQLKTIIDAAQAAPSSIGGQQVTIIAIRDKERKAKIAQLAGGQPYIDEASVFLLFCADFNRSQIACELNGQEMQIQKSVESILVGSVDVGLSMGFAIAAAESMNLGTVCIGAIRANLEDVAEFVDAPQNVFPLVGLVVGHPADHSQLKPRLPREAIFHNERYQSENLRPLIEQYDKDYHGYVDQRGGEPHTWSSFVTRAYKQVYAPNVKALLKKQGFDLE